MPVTVACSQSSDSGQCYAARADQAKAKTRVIQVERALKRAMKALESKVSPS